MKLIDAHHHLWEPQALPYTWLRQIGKPKPFGTQQRFKEIIFRKITFRISQRQKTLSWLGLFMFKQIVPYQNL